MATKAVVGEILDLSPFLVLEPKNAALRGMPNLVILCIQFPVANTEGKMTAKGKLKRKSYFVDERAIARAQEALGVKTGAEVIRLSVERVAEMEEFWQFMNKSRRTLKPGSVEKS